MAQETIVCPSGLAGEVRGFKVREANLLADKAALKRGNALDGVLKGCWLSTSSYGPYAFAEDAGGQKVIDWSKVLICDRFYTLIRIRAATYGDEYTFKVRCQDDACKGLIDWELNLSELPFKELPESSRELLRAGTNRFPFTMPDGKQAWFSLQTGASEASASALVKQMQSRAIGASIASRLVEIEGIPPGMKNRYIDDIDMGDLRSILDAFDEADGGVETTFSVECSSCGMEQDVELPFGKDFYLPTTKKKSA